MKKSHIIILAALVLTTSCVSLSDYRRLEGDYAQFKASIAQRQGSLEDEVKAFQQGYNPELHNILNTNLDEAKNYYERIGDIRRETEILDKIINTLVADSQKGKSIVEENARSSVSQNVVNDFNTLKISWNLTLANLSGMANEARTSAMKAQNEATSAGQHAAAAEVSANKIAETTQNIIALGKGMTDLGLRMDRLEIATKALQNQSIADELEYRRGLELVNLTLKNLSARVQELEKSLGALQGGDKKGPPSGDPGTGKK